MSMLADEIGTWLRANLDVAQARGIAVGLSGGIDSAVVAAVAARALGPDAVTGVIMPAHSMQADIDDARLLATSIGITPLLIDLSGPFDSISTVLPPGSQLASANIKPRLRMITLYHIANSNGLLVCGTGNKSELLAGYFTKYGDGGVDLLPLGSLYKHQVRDLAREIGVPEKIIDRAPSAGLWEGQTDEEEMGLTYEELDGILSGLEANDVSGYPPETVRKVQSMIDRSTHKRSMPPIFRPSRAVSMLEMA